MSLTSVNEHQLKQADNEAEYDICHFAHLLLPAQNPIDPIHRQLTPTNHPLCFLNPL